MAVVIDGSLGIDTIQDGAVGTAAKLGAAVVTPPKLSGAQGGNAPVFGARAWCTFNGTATGTNAPTAGGNVTSVTRNSAGNYTVNFTSALSDINYCISGAGVVSTSLCFISATTSSVTFSTNSTSSGAAIDSSTVCLQVIK